MNTCTDELTTLQGSSTYALTTDPCRLYGEQGRILTIITPVTENLYRGLVRHFYEKKMQGWCNERKQFVWLENSPFHNITLFANGRPPLKIVLFIDIRIILLRNKWLAVVTLLRPGVCFPPFPFLVSVINGFVCETNRYLCDLAGLFSKLCGSIGGEYGFPST